MRLRATRFISGLVVGLIIGGAGIAMAGVTGGDGTVHTGVFNNAPFTPPDATTSNESIFVYTIPGTHEVVYAGMAGSAWPPVVPPHMHMTVTGPMTPTKRGAVTITTKLDPGVALTYNEFDIVIRGKGTQTHGTVKTLSDGSTIVTFVVRRDAHLLSGLIAGCDPAINDPYTPCSVG